MVQVSRKPEIMGDSAHAILTKPSRECTGNFFIDEEVLRAEGVTDFSVYGPASGQKPLMDFFVPDEVVVAAEALDRLQRHHQMHSNAQ